MKNKQAWITALIDALIDALTAALTAARKPAVAVTLSIGALMLAAAPATAADVGVSVQISQPGVYGRIDIGRFPQPQVVVAQPVIIVRPVAVVVPPQPVYLWVPPGHRKNWRKHCGAYGACGVPVYFVQDQWYDDHVRYEGKGKHKDKHKYKDRDDDKGHGHGHGKHKD